MHGQHAMQQSTWMMKVDAGDKVMCSLYDPDGDLQCGQCPAYTSICCTWVGIFYYAP